MKEPGESSLIITSTEIKLAQVLSANDRDVRLSGLRKLNNWLTLRATEGSLTDAELSHVWVGLHYCLWMQDKPVLQEELIEAFSGLLQQLGEKGDVALRFFDEFLELECRQWLAIDCHRLDKYLLLIRAMLNAVLSYLAKNEWQEESLKTFLSIFRRRLTQVPSSEAHDGLKFHVADIFIEELTKIESEYQIPQSVVLRLLKPYCELLATHQGIQMLTKVRQRVFGELIDQAQAYSLAVLEREARQDSSQNGEEMETDEARDEEDDELPIRLNVDLEKLADCLTELRRTEAAKVATTKTKKGEKKKRTKAAANEPVIRNRKILKKVAFDLQRATKVEDEFDEDELAEWEELVAVRGGKRRERKENAGLRKPGRTRPLAEALEDEIEAIDERELHKAIKKHCALERPVRNDESDEEEAAVEKTPVKRRELRLTKSKLLRKLKLKKKKLKKRKNAAFTSSAVF